MEPREDLWQRLQQIEQYTQTLPDYQTFGDALESDSFLAYLCSDALRLAGVAEDWVKVGKRWDADLVSWLLLPRNDAQGIPTRSVIFDINWPPGDAGDAGQKQDLSPQSYEEMIAALWSFTTNLQDALALARSHPADELVAICKAKSKIDADLQAKADPESAKRAMQRKFIEKAKSSMADPLEVRLGDAC